MKIIGVSSSPRRGNSEFMLRTVLNKAKELGAETEVLVLREKDIKLCDGCQLCDDGKECQIKDDMQEIYPKILAADVMVFSSSVYYDMITPHLLNFIDRLNCLEGKLKDKKFAFLLAGSCKGKEGEESQEGAIYFFKEHLVPIWEAKLIGHVSGFGLKKADEAGKRQDVIEECKKLAEKIVKP